MNWLRSAWAIFEKDLKLELRHRYAINMLLMFVASSLLLVLFAVGQEPISQRVQSALLWIVILFSSAVGLGRAFISEEEAGTVMVLQLNARPSMVYAGKFLYNLILVLLLNLVAVLAFLFLLSVEVQVPALLGVTLFLGALGLSGTTTLLAAIIARTANRGPLFAVLLFPVLVPLLLSVVSATLKAMEGTTWNDVSQELISMASYAGVVITASVLLFDYVWND